LGIPSDHHSSFLRGAAGAPPRIREALLSSSTNRSTEDGDELGSDVIYDAGDLALPSPEGAFEEIESSIAALLGRGYRPISLGGDHAITLPVLRAFRSQGELDVVHFDAHPDLYDEFEGDRYSHACPFARIMEEGLARRLFQLGIRTATDDQRKQAARFGVETIEMRAWRSDLMLPAERPVYVSVDLDVLDPAFAPGVSHWEPGGLSTRELIAAIQSIRAPVIGADVVEYNPARDPSGVTAYVAAKIVKELASRMRA
jgi:agmatinase